MNRHARLSAGMALLPVLALARPQGPMLDEPAYRWASAESSARTVRATDPPFPTIVNPGFEELGSNQQPTGWFIRDNPVVLQTEGNRVARVNGSASYAQTVAAPAPGQHVTASARVRGELGLEGARFSTFLFDGDYGIFDSVRVAVPSGVFERRHGSVPVLPGRSRLEFLFLGSDGLSWIDLDDVVLFDEGLDDGGFEAPLAPGHVRAWNLEAGATTIGNAGAELLLPPGGSATQLATAVAGPNRYFLSGLARAAQGTSATLRLSESWRDSAEGELATTSTLIAVPAAPTRFAWHAGAAPGGSQVAFSSVAAHAGEILVDDVSRGFTMVAPRKFTPGPDSVSPRVQFTANWQRALASGRVEVRDSEGDLRADLAMSVDRGVGTVEWDGGTELPGGYAVTFLLQELGGDTIALNDALTITAPPAPVVHDRFTTDTMLSIAWMWFLNSPSDMESLRPFFESAAADGFNAAIVTARPDQFAAVRNLCEEHGLGFILADNDILTIPSQAPEIVPLDPADYLAFVRGRVQSVTDSPQYLGLYVEDEPVRAWEVDTTARVHRIIEREADLGPSFHVQTRDFAAQPDWTLMRPPVHWVDYYPLTGVGPGHEESLRQMAEFYRQQSSIARFLERDFWVVAQAFTSPDFYRLPGDAATHAVFGLAVAFGAKGISPFLYTSVNALEGLVSTDAERIRFREADLWAQNNARIHAASTTLAALTDHAPASVSVLGPVHVGTATHPDGGRYLFAVSLNLEQPVSLSLFSGDDFAVLDEITGKPGVTVSLGEGVVALEPGGWRAFRLPGGFELTSALAIPAPLPAPPLNLPVLGDRPLGNSPPVNVTYESGGQRAAVAATRALRIVDRDGATFASFLGSNVLNARVASADRAVGADFTQGPRLARLDGVPPILLPGASRVAGGAYDVLPLGDGRHWSTIHFMGARLLEETPEGAFVSLSHASDGGILRDLLGPFGDGSAWALVVESGIRRLALSPGGDIELSPATDLPRVWKADLTEDLRLAAGARGRAGVVLFRVNPADGTILETAPLHDPELGHAEDVAWISHELLAIADEGGVIRFHRVTSDLSTTPAGWWRLPVTPDRAVSLDSNGFELMIATARARIIVVDVTGLRGSAWMLF